MIVVVGTSGWRASEPSAPAGRACGIALSAARAGARVQLVGRIGDDANGDALLIALARDGVGHAAMLRDPARATPIMEPAPSEDEPVPDAPGPAAREPVMAPGAAPAPAPRLEPEDVSLGLRYLAGFDVVVATDDVPPEVLPVIVEAATYGGAHLVMLTAPDSEAPAATPDGSTVLAVPAEADDGAFAALVGTYAAAIDAGVAPAVAFAGAAAGVGWEATQP